MSGLHAFAEPPLLNPNRKPTTPLTDMPCRHCTMHRALHIVMNCSGRTYARWGRPGRSKLVTCPEPTQLDNVSHKQLITVSRVPTQCADSRGVSRRLVWHRQRVRGKRFGQTALGSRSDGGECTALSRCPPCLPIHAESGLKTGGWTAPRE